MRTSIAAVLIGACCGIAAAAPPPTQRSRPEAVPPFAATSHRTFEDVEHWKKVFDDPKRDRWQRPDEVVAALGLAPGMRVADLGAGTGYFSARLSRAVGETGTVFAVEVEPNLVVHLRERAEQEDLANVVPVLASAAEPRLPRAAIDLVLIVDTYHHVDDRLRYLKRLQGALAPGGRVAVIDWQAGKLPEGPPPEHKIARDRVLDEMIEAGYELAGEPEILPYQYFLIFRPAP